MYDSDDGEEEWFDAEHKQSGESIGHTSNGAIPSAGFRTHLPAPMISRKDFSVWSFLKQCIGKELSKITMPVVFNEPLSFLQRLGEYMEYPGLLEKAVASEDPVRRMEYVAAFAVSCSASNWERLGKPFNPLLGETYELNREDLGFKMISEQVSHHPPVSAFHVDSPHYTFHGTIYPKLKFWGKSVEVTPKGVLTLTFPKYGESYTWSNIICCCHNVIVGKLWIEHYGTMEIVNHKTGHKIVLNFKPSGWFGKDLHKLEGYLYDSNKKKLRAFYGKWTEALYSHDVKAFENWKENYSRNDTPEHVPPTVESNQDDETDDLPPVRQSSCNLQLLDEQLLWEATPRPDDSADYYNFTHFSITLNDLNQKLKSTLSPTDSRLRPDIRHLEEGNVDGAAREKTRLEEKQRAARKLRKEKSEKWEPKWFVSQKNRLSGKEDWIFTKDYWKRDWNRCPDIF